VLLQRGGCSATVVPADGIDASVQPFDTPFCFRSRSQREERMKRLAIGTSVLMVLSFVPVILAAAPAQASCSTAGCAAPVPCNTSLGACWKPATNARWQYQLSAAKDKPGNCLFTSMGGTNSNITGTTSTGGAAVAPSVFDTAFQTDGACTG